MTTSTSVKQATHSLPYICQHQPSWTPTHLRNPIPIQNSCTQRRTSTTYTPTEYTQTLSTLDDSLGLSTTYPSTAFHRTTGTIETNLYAAQQINHPQDPRKTNTSSSLFSLTVQSQWSVCLLLLRWTHTISISQGQHSHNAMILPGSNSSPKTRQRKARQNRREAHGQARSCVQEERDQTVPCRRGCCWYVPYPTPAISIHLTLPLPLNAPDLFLSSLGINGCELTILNHPYSPSHLRRHRATSDRATAAAAGGLEIPDGSVGPDRPCVQMNVVCVLRFCFKSTEDVLMGSISLGPPR